MEKLPRAMRIQILVQMPDWKASQSRIRRELHVSRQAREKYELEDYFFTITGEVVFANIQAARMFARKLNARRDVRHHPEQAVSTAEVIALGLVDELQHFLFQQYRQTRNPAILRQMIAYFQERFGADSLEETFLRFMEHFPPLPVYRGQISARDYLNGSTEGTSHRELLMEEMIMLWLENVNPAMARFRELFDDAPLKADPVYAHLPEEAPRVFASAPGFGPGEENFWEVLQEHIRVAPHDLKAQLAYLRRRWGLLLQPVERKLLVGLDVIKEEEKIFQVPPPGAPPPPPPLLVPRYPAAGQPEAEVEPEQYTPDVAWMPRLVLMAKHTLVWLDQLSRKYKRPIQRLDEIPEEELDQLARWGFNGLWLIGIWERSPASRKIKHLCGNPQAEASAYAIYDYQVARRLGGEEAFQTLKQRCWQRGIRLAGDMVPNHTGIDARWVLEHPDWYIQLPYPPYPSYRFTGPDLAEHPHISIRIEDHYYDQSDAAVVFQWQDRRTGQVRYIYHGNDGTSMPWNDTAQLNYLLPEVREAVIQTILEIARKVPIIRFDAAMTLTKRHYQRLWFPEPGKGGDIPSRAEHGMTREEFDRHMPGEFWREVVDRVAEEAPETLLLAEAFWLMEGYFVRTLGMHRVYNSAFMNMLKAEENGHFRQLICNTLEFDPEILKRYVNFMSNPDEEPAAVGFGKGDKYFGVCTMMATLPGLPMFAHGQIEGLVEKYGMEFARAYLDESPDQELIERHEKEIFPLLKKRALFAEVEHFAFYDCLRPDGRVVEDVFAYSNRQGEERALVLYNNRWRAARGVILHAVPRVKKLASEGKRIPVKQTLGEALGLTNQPQVFCIYQEHPGGLEYIRPSRDFFNKGFPVELSAYQYRVFWGFREVMDDAESRYWKVYRKLGGRGVPSVEEEVALLPLEPIHQVLREWLNPLAYRQWRKALLSQPEQEPPPSAEAGSGSPEEEIGLAMAEKLARLQESQVNPAWKQQKIRQWQAARLLPLGLRKLREALQDEPSLDERLEIRLEERESLWAFLYCWLLVQDLKQMLLSQPEEWNPLQEWRVFRLVREFWETIFPEQPQLTVLTGALELLEQLWPALEKEETIPGKLQKCLEQCFSQPEGQRLLGINRFQEILWFNKERFEALLDHLLVLLLHATLAGKVQPTQGEESRSPETGLPEETRPLPDAEKGPRNMADWEDWLPRAQQMVLAVQEVRRLADACNYQVEPFLSRLEEWVASGEGKSRKTAREKGVDSANAPDQAGQEEKPRRKTRRRSGKKKS